MDNNHIEIIYDKSEDIGEKYICKKSHKKHKLSIT